MSTAEYYRRQAELAARLALAESGPIEAAALHVLALERYDKAENAKAAETPPASQGTILNPEDHIS